MTSKPNICAPSHKIVIPLHDDRTLKKTDFYLRSGQTRPDSKGSWYPFLTNTLEELPAVRKGYFILTSALDISSLTPEESAELQGLLKEPATDPNRPRVRAEREEHLLADLPRVTLSGGFDFDADIATNDPTLLENIGKNIAAMERLVLDECSRRGWDMRRGFSGNPENHKRHVEWGVCSEGGDPNLHYAMLGQARDVCRAIGLVPRAGSPGFALKWCMPHDPRGLLGFIDLGNLNRSPMSRGSCFRAMGAPHKNLTHRKKLIEGSPQEGAPITRAMIDHGLALYQTQEESRYGKDAVKARISRKRNTAIPIVPDGAALPLHNTKEVVESWWEEGRGHDLRMTLSSVLLQTGLLSVQSVEAVLLATTIPETAHDAAPVLRSTLARMHRGAPLRGTTMLRDQEGTVEVMRLARALAADLDCVTLGYVWSRIASKRINTAEELQGAVSALKDLAAKAEGEERGKITKVWRRLLSSAYCMKRVLTGTCTGCRGTRMDKHLPCEDSSCPTCIRQRTRDHLELIVLPERADIAHKGGYVSKAAARKAYKRCLQFLDPGDLRPRELYTPEPDGTYSLTMIANSDHAPACAAISMLANASRQRGVSRHETKTAIERAILAKHVVAREVIETGEHPERLVEVYRKHITSQKKPASIAWPTKEEIRIARMVRAQDMADKKALNPDAETSPRCQCSEECHFPAVYEVTKADTKEVVASGLALPPTLAQIVAYELKERVSLHKGTKRRTIGSMGRRQE